MEKKYQSKIIIRKDIKDIKLLEMEEDDLELVMAWRSNPLIYKFFYIQDSPLKWEEHINFWKSRKDRKDWIILFKDNERWRKIGSVNASNLSDSHPEIGIFIGEITLWNKGLAEKTLKMVITWLKKMKYKGAKASISKKNKGSQRLFEKLNLKKGKSIKNGKEWEYTINFN